MKDFAELQIKTALDRVEEVVKWCLDNDLYTIINVHHDTGMNSSLNWIFADADNYEENLNKYIKPLFQKYVNHVLSEHLPQN